MISHVCTAAVFFYSLVLFLESLVISLISIMTKISTVMKDIISETGAAYWMISSVFRQEVGRTGRSS